MSTWDMIKLWFIKEIMPLLIVLAIIILLVIGCILWAMIDNARLAIKRRFRRKSNANLHRTKMAGDNVEDSQ